MKTLLDCLFVALGGAVGSVSRYLLGKLPVKTAGFPVITLGINVIGAFCIGLIVAAVGKHSGGNFTACQHYSLAPTASYSHCFCPTFMHFCIGRQQRTNSTARLPLWAA